MINYAIYSSDGKYVSRGTALTEESIGCEPGEGVYIGEVDPVHYYHNLKENCPTPYPEKPSVPIGVSLTFDFEKHSWTVNAPLSWLAIRSLRDRLLSESDWVTLRAQEQGVQVPQEWLDYRQALRDITEQEDPLAIVWPTPPRVSKARSVQ